MYKEVYRRRRQWKQTHQHTRTFLNEKMKTKFQIKYYRDFFLRREEEGNYNFKRARKVVTYTETHAFQIYTCTGVVLFLFYVHESIWKKLKKNAQNNKMMVKTVTRSISCVFFSNHSRATTIRLDNSIFSSSLAYTQ